MKAGLAPTRPALLLALATLLAAVYLGSFACRGFLPQDDGYHAHIAERILDGELPHVDFHDGYVGGLGFLNALGLELFGARFASIRLTQYLVFLLSIPLVYWLCLGFCSAAVSFCVTLLCVVWTLPNFPIASASWYSLPFWLLGTAGLVRFIRTRNPRWLWLAGFAGGLGLLIKSAFLFLALAASLALTYHEHEHAPEHPGVPRSRLFLAVKAAALACVLVALHGLLARTGGFSEMVYFGAPVLVICALLLAAERRRGGGFGQRISGLVRLLVPFWVAFLLPIGAFLATYAATGHARDFYEDVVVTTSRHLDFGARPLPPGAALYVGGSLLAGLLFVALNARLRDKRLLCYGVTAVVLGVVLASTQAPVYRATWSTLRAFVPVATVLACALLTKPERVGDPSRRTAFFTLVVVMQLASLVQVPWAIPVYLLFAIPFLFLVLAALASVLSLGDARLVVPPMMALILWGLLWANRGNFWVQGFEFQPSPFVARLDSAKSGLTVSESQARLYDTLIPYVQEHAGESPYILAFPDSPEIYFLTGKKNPRRLLFDFVEEPESATTLADLVTRHGIELVVLRLNPEFSVDSVSRGVVAFLEQRFPKKYRIGAHVVYSLR